MLGKPKFKLGEKIKFDFNELQLEGTIEIIDAYGTFEQNKEVSYDIIVENSPHFNGEPCIYKHITENFVHKI